MSESLITTSQEFGKKVRATRKSLGFTQPQLAGATGVGVRFIVDLERGKSTCGLDKALRVALILGLRVTISDPSGLLQIEKQ